MFVWYRELVEHVFHICGNGVCVASEPIDYSLEGVVPVGALSKLIVYAGSADWFGSRIPYYPGFPFLLHGEKRNPIGHSIVVEYSVAWYWLESGVVSIGVLGELLEGFEEVFRFFFPHPLQGSFGALQGCGPIKGEFGVLFGEW